MLAARRTLAVSVAISLLLVHTADAQAVGSSASGASTVSSGEYAKLAHLQLPRSMSCLMASHVTLPLLAAMGGLIQQFAASQSQSQLGLASQVFGLNSGSNSHPFLTGSTSDCKFALKH